MYVDYMWCYLFNFKSWLGYILYLQNPFGVALKSRGPMLEFSHGKIWMDNELNILTVQLYTQEIRTCFNTTLLNVMAHLYEYWIRYLWKYGPGHSFISMSYRNDTQLASSWKTRFKCCLILLSFILITNNSQIIHSIVTSSKSSA